MLCCAAGVCESSLVVCAHEHGAIKVGAGRKRGIWHFQQSVNYYIIHIAIACVEMEKRGNG